MNTILEIGPSSDLALFFPSKQILNIPSQDTNKIPRFLKRKDILFISINTGPFNGSTVKLIRDIRKEYSGLLIIFVASVDCYLSKKFLDAGASDVVFQNDVNQNTLDKIVERYNIKMYAQDTLKEIRSGLTKIPKLQK